MNALGRIGTQQVKLHKNLLSCAIDPSELKLIEKIGQGKEQYN